MKALIGHTGFVGSNLAQATLFDKVYNSKNIGNAFDEEYDIVVYAGVRAEKFLANKKPESDYEHIEQTIQNIKRIKTKQLVLISTIDVYKTTDQVDEDTVINTDDLQPYGLNRYLLEKWVKEHIPNALIVRLPALYGENLKKNFIFDMMTVIPSMIKREQFIKLEREVPIKLNEYYEKQENDFYKIRLLNDEQRSELKAFFESYNFNALSFTDSRNIYQFYPLRFLWQHIQVALENKLTLVCLNSEPVSASELYQAVFKKPFVNITTGIPIKYALKSKYADLFGGTNGYIYSKEFILNDICNFLTMGD